MLFIRECFYQEKKVDYVVDQQGPSVMKIGSEGIDTYPDDDKYDAKRSQKSDSKSKSTSLKSSKKSKKVTSSLKKRARGGEGGEAEL